MAWSSGGRILETHDASGPVADELKLLFSADDIRARVAGLGQRISVDYQGRDLILVAVLNGAALFAADLVRALAIPVTLDFLRAASYGPSTESTGVVQIRKDVETPVLGRDVLIVEDIVDTGLTARFLVDHLSAGQPRSIEVCTLLDKPSRRRAKLAPKYVGFEIGDVFVVGYGMDYNQRHRQLPGVYCVEPSPIHEHGIGTAKMSDSP